MKKILFLVSLSVIATASFARGEHSHVGYSYGASHDTNVSGYTRSDGKYVESYHRSSANGTQTDNYSSIGNTNPYTGEEGTHTPLY